DLGAKQLREVLYEQTEIGGLFGFENRKEVFEGVHRSYKFVVLTFRKGGNTKEFPCAFMRHDVEDLYRFPNHDAVVLSVDLIKKFSPDSWSIPEIKSTSDLIILQKVYEHPILRDEIRDVWDVEFHREFNMTDDAFLFHR